MLGAGAIGGGIGGLLALSGQEVALVARGAHAEALRRDGLTLELPRAHHRLRLPLVEVGEAEPSDVVWLCTKVQDTAAALEGLDPRVRVVVLQNGLDGTRQAVARGHPTVPAMVYVPAVHLDPGSVRLHGRPHPGRLDVGGDHGAGSAVLSRLVQTLSVAGLHSTAFTELRPWRLAKLLTNLAGVVQALQGRLRHPDPVVLAAQAEARACFRAHDWTWQGTDELLAHVGPFGVGLAGGLAREGGSTLQSLLRGVALETPYLNGEIVALGEAAGVPTPVNRILVDLAQRAQEEGWRPGHLDPAEVREACGC